jgi:hypothetical protein
MKAEDFSSDLTIELEEEQSKEVEAEKNYTMNIHRKEIGRSIFYYQQW